MTAPSAGIEDRHEVASAEALNCLLVLFSYSLSLTVLCESITPMQNSAAIAASTALPPRSSVSLPGWEVINMLEKFRQVDLPSDL